MVATGRSARSRFTLFLLLLGVAAVAWATDVELEIRNARVTELIPGQRAVAGYLDLHNPGTQPVELVEFYASAYGEVQLHETIENDGMMVMRELAGIVVPAGETVSLRPGGVHLMLIGPSGSIPSGEPVELRLVSTAGKVYDIDARIVKAGDAGAMDSHMH